MNEIILARDESECVQRMLEGLLQAEDAARQLAFQYRVSEAKGWLAYADQLSAGRQIAAALVSMKAAKQELIFGELLKKKH